ncbi:hypothetical protein C9J85_13890 [Haloferax sp. wsp5]|nr:hypothetical protein C9J85_13890 [Haloferax sp. wsp5]
MGRPRRRPWRPPWSDDNIQPLASHERSVTRARSHADVEDVRESGAGVGRTEDGFIIQVDDASHGIDVCI